MATIWAAINHTHIGQHTYFGCILINLKLDISSNFLGPLSSESLGMPYRLVANPMKDETDRPRLNPSSAL